MEEKSMNPADMEVEKNEDRQRFEARLEGELAVIEYEMLAGNVIDFVHTEVPSALRGRGVAEHLARTVLEYAREQELEVVAQCPYVAGYIDRHPEYRSLLSSTG